MSTKIQELKDLLDGKDEISCMLEKLGATNIQDAILKSYENGLDDGQVIGYSEGRNDLAEEIGDNDDEIKLPFDLETNDIDVEE
jgi:hypothetical protein